MSKTKSKTCSPSSHRAGLTLIEVIAAIAILGTILVGVVLAKARHTHQIAQTRLRMQAVQLADELIAGWWVSPDGIPIDQRGSIDGEPTWTWQTRRVDNHAIDKLGARVVRVTLYSDRADESMVAVDLVLSEPEPRRGGDDE